MILSKLPYEHPLRVAQRCRREMRSWAMWWRRGGKGSSREFVLKGAITMRNSANAMEAQAKRIGGAK